MGAAPAKVRASHMGGETSCLLPNYTGRRESNGVFIYGVIILMKGKPHQHRSGGTGVRMWLVASSQWLVALGWWTVEGGV